MSEDDDVIDREIKTPMTFMISRVSEEGTSGGPGCQFMMSLGGEVGIASATEHLQVLIGGGNTVESDIRQYSRIILLGRWFGRYVVVWSSSI
jgi:hypothetical protein